MTGEIITWRRISRRLPTQPGPGYLYYIFTERHPAEPSSAASLVARAVFLLITRRLRPVMAVYYRAISCRPPSLTLTWPSPSSWLVSDAGNGELPHWTQWTLTECTAAV